MEFGIGSTDQSGIMVVGNHMAKDQRTVFLPVLERELRVQARKKITYRLRWITALVALLIGGSLLWAFSSTPLSANSSSQVFYLLAGLGILFSLIEGVRLACDSISRETREGTLGLLFLTDLKEYEIILGKVGACSLSAFYAMLASFPILGISLLLGGLMFGELFRVGIVLVVSLFYSISLSLLVSSRCKEESRSMVGAVSLVCLMVFLLPVLLDVFLPSPFGEWGAWTSPFAAFGNSSDIAYQVNPLGFWSRIAVLLVLSVGCLALAARRLRTTWMTEKSTTADHRRPHPFWLRARLSMNGSDNPIFNLAAHRHVRSLWLVFGFFFYLYVVSILEDRHCSFLLPMIFFVIKVVIGWKACVDFQKAKQCGALELWLTSSLTVREIISGKRQAMNRWFLAGLVLVTSALLLYWFQSMLINTNNDILFAGIMGTFVDFGHGPMPFDTNMHNLIVLAMLGVVFFFDTWAMIWMGMWHGLAGRSIVEAETKAFYWVLLLPWLVMFISQVFFMFGGGFDPEELTMQTAVTVLTVFADIWFVIYAKRKLNRRFRDVAAEAFMHKPAWWERVFNRIFRRAAGARVTA
ncbi:MAG TPA: ABC transporter permease subunit [Verrucomicrobiae bacterium]